MSACTTQQTCFLTENVFIYSLLFMRWEQNFEMRVWIKCFRHTFLPVSTDIVRSVCTTLVYELSPCQTMWAFCAFFRPNNYICRHGLAANKATDRRQLRFRMPTTMVERERFGERIPGTAQCKRITTFYIQIGDVRCVTNDDGFALEKSIMTSLTPRIHSNVTFPQAQASCSTSKKRV